MIRLSAIGDVINTLPALTLLRQGRPDAYIAFAVEDRACELVIGHPLLDRAFVFPRRRWRELLRSGDPRRWLELRSEVSEYARALRSERFDVSLDFQGSLKGAVHARASGASRRIGFARGADREMSHLFATERVHPPIDRPHRVDKFASLLEPLEIRSPERRYVLPTTPLESKERVGRFLVEAGFGERPIVLVHPGTSARGSAKRWPAERFKLLVRRICAELGADVVVTWGPGEKELAESVACGDAPVQSETMAMRDAARAVIGPANHSLLELAELIRDARVFVSGDTGPMHLAAATGTTCVALFGPKDPAVYRPYGSQHVVIRAGGVSGPRRDMEQITVDEVLAAVAGRLARTLASDRME